MEYLCLIAQMLLLLGTIFLNTGDGYILNFDKIYKNYLILESIVQSLCIIINVRGILFFKKMMVYVVIIDVYLVGLIKIFFTIYAKNKFYKNLTKLIIEEHLEKYTPNEIRKYLIDKFNILYFIDDIEKCLIKINS